MKAAYLSMLTADDCLTFGETAFTLFRYTFALWNQTRRMNGLLPKKRKLFLGFGGVCGGDVAEDKCFRLS